MTPPPPCPELESILSMLSAFAHRNKNQHRLSKWWKPFSQLRRHVSALTRELEVAHREEQRYGAGRRKALAAREAVERRAGFLVAALVPRAFAYVVNSIRSFSMLVADNQYAALGLMLLATLARVRKLILPLVGEAEAKDDSLEGAMEAVKQDRLDLGEVIQRDEILDGAVKDEEIQGAIEMEKPKDKKRELEEEPRSRETVGSTPTKRPKKKRKKGDAFDDIFDSLI